MDIDEKTLKERVLVNYSMKTKYMVDNFISESDIDNFISLLNYCFHTKNKFFIEAFNIKMIKNVYKSYNRIKTNIIDKDCLNLVEGLSEKDLKLLRFICNNYVGKFDEIKQQEDIITQYIPKESIMNISKSLEFRMKIVK